MEARAIDEVLYLWTLPGGAASLVAVCKWTKPVPLHPMAVPSGVYKASRYQAVEASVKSSSHLGPPLCQLAMPRGALCPSLSHALNELSGGCVVHRQEIFHAESKPALVLKAVCKR